MTSVTYGHLDGPTSQGAFLHRAVRVWDYPPDPSILCARWRCGRGGHPVALVADPDATDRLGCARCGVRDSGDTSVYFAEADGLIKIGCSSHVDRRLEHLEARLLATMPGGYALEAAFHRVFATSRVHGEWFTPTPPLLAHIAHLNEARRAA